MSSSQRVLGGALSRRNVLGQIAGAGAVMAIGGSAASADNEETPQFKEALKNFLGSRTLGSDTLVELTLPEIAENGNMVPFSVAVASPMTDDDHVRSISLFSSGNPQPVIATFHLSPVSGRAVVSGRLRLARSQDVMAIAELSSGALVAGRANVKVTIGGCGG